ncbi:hypothetical protein QBC40DRAFT_278172 [Triangularia verruculosa]|uniref:Uncharacterized protein n=1 Tax=Triangularia verruculosa TaxID=2587418 RepID=A0AAN7AWW1_9PEZI|nr:hypothetical protein QBC40DRAFT_278172 [Triangularia verruculosa]
MRIFTILSMTLATGITLAAPSHLAPALVKESTDDNCQYTCRCGSLSAQCCSLSGGKYDEQGNRCVDMNTTVATAFVGCCGSIPGYGCAVGGGCGIL